MKIKALILTVFLFSCTAVHAQFTTLGSDPASIKWMHLDTPNYSIIYPKGLDSLARVYARNLEAIRLPISSTIGFIPNQNHSKRMPVILHAYTSESNGVVTWAPHRAELLTVPEYSRPEATPWEMQVTVHESRHIAQMQFTQAKPFIWARYLSGECLAGALSAIYPGSAFLEGDAVVAETALTEAGRGRTADFLEYYRVCWDKGQNRDYWQWRYGSQRFYTPDHYTIGYIMMGGMRSVYDCPDFTKRYFERIRKHGGFAFWNFQKTIKETSGKNLPDAFAEISGRMSDEWKKDAYMRGPFIPSEQVSETPRSFTEYSDMDFDGDFFLIVKKGIRSSAELISFKNGKERKISEFSPNASSLKSSPVTKKFYWSECKPDIRWERRSFSDIRYCDENGKLHTLTHKRRFFNPAPSPEENIIAVTEYPTEGGSRLVLVDAISGQDIKSFPAPDGMQIVESAWDNGKIYVSAITGEGFGIYALEGFTPILSPQKLKINNLSSGEDEDSKLNFISDRTGVNELYSLNVANGQTEQITNTRYGIGDYCFAGDTLFYTMLQPEGRVIFMTDNSSLLKREVDFSERHTYEMAETLSEGEPMAITETDVEMKEPEPYSKIAHLFRFHSWLPLYFNYDDINSISFDNLYLTAGLGVTGYFQNDLGTAYGTIAYNAQFKSSEWRHTGHLKFTYAGLYPVFEASLDFNTRNSRKYSYMPLRGGTEMPVAKGNVPLLSFNLKTYVPFTFNSGGWRRGLVPQVNVSLSNDMVGIYNRRMEFTESTPLFLLNTSLRGYIMLRTAESCIYPRWGVGAEAGYSARPALDNIFCSTAYGYIYGYVPGIARTHGIKLSATGAFQASSAPFCEEAISTVPRGFNSDISDLMSVWPNRTKLSFDYALPFAPVDWTALCPIAYIRNFEFTAHTDFTFLNSSTESGNLFSVGADLTVRLGNFLWVPYATRIGVSFDYNGGSLFGKWGDGFNQGRTSVRFLFSIDL